MPNFSRNDLLGFYNWPANGSSSLDLKRDPDSSVLDRSNGYEVLYMIHILMKYHNQTSIEAGQEIEMMIKVAPTHLQTKEEVKAWIDAN